jgi:hypothetical protein
LSPTHAKNIGKARADYEFGVKELGGFDPEEPEGRRVRVWDSVEDDLLERVIVAIGYSA